jgi:hypothetical protein
VAGSGALKMSRHKRARSRASILVSSRLDFGADLVSVRRSDLYAGLPAGFIWDDDAHLTGYPCIIRPLGLKRNLDNECPIFVLSRLPLSGGTCALGIGFVDELLQKRASLDQHLIDMPVGFFHSVENGRYVRFRNVLVKQVTHGVDENHPRAFPLKWLYQAHGAQRQVKACFERMTRDAAKSLRKSRCIAVVTARADFCAAGNGIPSRIGPFNRAVFGHELVTLKCYCDMAGATAYDFASVFRHRPDILFGFAGPWNPKREGTAFFMRPRARAAGPHRRSQRAAADLRTPQANESDSSARNGGTSAN